MVSPGLNGRLNLRARLRRDTACAWQHLLAPPRLLRRVALRTRFLALNDTMAGYETILRLSLFRLPGYLSAGACGTRDWPQPRPVE